MADLVIILPILLFSVIVHEIAHGWVALKCGDPTARDAGRLTLNPIPHIDPIGSIVFPVIARIVGFIPLAWAKPVPVNPYLLRGGEKDHVKVSFAGPASNILLAMAAFVLSLIVSFIARVTASSAIWSLIGLLNVVVFINLILANFNLLPIPPLDGSWIMAYFLKGEVKRSYQSLRRYGFLILILFLMLGSRIRVGGTNLFDLLFIPSIKISQLCKTVQLHLI